MQLIIYLSLIEIALGMGVIHCFIPRKALGPGFGKTISTIVFFCLLGPVLMAPRLLPPMPDGGDGLIGIRLCGAAALAFWFAYFVALNYPAELPPRVLVVLAVLAQCGMTLFTCLLLARHFNRGPGAESGYTPTVPMLILALTTGLTSSALLLGSVTMAMLIGHWYLVIPGLAIEWLKGACLAFGGALAYKVAAISISLLIGVYNHPFGLSGFFDLIRIEGALLFCLRLLVGIFLPLGFCAMAYKAAAMRATQSSTGILFPAMIVVFLGEMIASFLIIGLGGLCV